MSAAAVLASGRRAALARMRDTCLIREVTGVVTDPLTGVDTPTYATLYSGVCRIPPNHQWQNSAEAGGVVYVIGQFRVDLPITAPSMPPDAVFTLTGCPDDPVQVGRTGSVVQTMPQSQATVRRIIVKETVGA